MVLNYLIQQTVDNYQRTTQQLKNASYNGNPEFIHAFRVEVKSLSGALFFFKDALQLTDSWPDKVLLDLKPYYKSSGKVRNLTVIQGLLLQHKDVLVDHDFVHYLKQRECNRLLKFKSVAREIKVPSSEELVKNLTALFSSNLNYNELLTVHLKKNKSRAIELITSNLPGEPWHEARAFLKRNYLLLKLMSDEVVDLQEMYQSRILEQELGNWHDFVMLEKAYTKFVAMQSKPSTEQKKFLEELKKLKAVHEKGIKSLFE